MFRRGGVGPTFVTALLAAVVVSASAQPVAIPDEAARREARDSERARHLREADAANRARLAAPASVAAREAKIGEAKARLRAALLGDDPLDAPTAELAREVRAGAEYSAEERFEVAVLEEFNRRRTAKFASREAWVQDREDTARRLLAEFPGLPGGHEHLLAAAAAHEGDRAVVLAQEILASGAAAETKAKARDLVVQRTISGRVLGEVANEIPGCAALLEKAKDRSLVFYTWAPRDRQAIERIRALAAALPAQVLFVGINVDPDSGTAVAAAASEGLPGEQLYGGRGHDSPFVRELALTRSGLAYAVDAHGVMRNLSGWRGASAFSGFFNGGSQ